MTRSLLAAVVLAGAATGPAVKRDGFRLTLPSGWTESPSLTKASQDRISPNAEGGAIAWERTEAKAIARVVWLRSRHPSGVGVREELEALHDVWRSEADDGHVVSWKVTEAPGLVTSTLVYRLGNGVEGKGKTVRQVAISGVDVEGRIRGWALECGYPTAAEAKAGKDCESLAASFAVTLPAGSFKPLDAPRPPPGAASGPDQAR